MRRDLRSLQRVEGTYQDGSNNAEGNLADAEAQVELRWSLARGEKAASLTPDRAREIAGVMSRVDEEERLETRVGLLEGVVKRTNYFELIDDEGEVVSGRISADILEDVREYFDRRVKAQLLVTRIRDRGTGVEKDTFRLMRLERTED